MNMCYGTEEGNVFGDVISFSIYVHGILIGSLPCIRILYHIRCIATQTMFMATIKNTLQNNRHIFYEKIPDLRDPSVWHE